MMIDDDVTTHEMTISTRMGDTHTDTALSPFFSLFDDGDAGVRMFFGSVGG